MVYVVVAQSEKDLDFDGTMKWRYILRNFIQIRKIV
ncbi:hypothetical protein FHS14_001488 [Paenibacillus baekrokdamisoli]|nr:hypothetical protein [Paenibacillus baekrokdamisoli]